MFFTISKLFTLFLMPFFWLVFAICWAIFAKTLKAKNNAIKVGLAILFIFGNNFLASSIMRYWQVKPLELAKMANFDVGIVLGGGIINDTKWPFDRVHFDASADRLLQAIQLYKLGKIKKILISAGTNNKFALKYHLTEADQSRRFLIMVGILEKDILIEGISLNTHENAMCSKHLLEKYNLSKSRLLLITSAYHMKRSVACYKKAGLLITGYPCNYFYTSINLLTFDAFIPDEYAFSIWYNLFHEWFGIAIYKLMGYI